MQIANNKIAQCHHQVHVSHKSTIAVVVLKIRPREQHSVKYFKLLRKGGRAATTYLVILDTRQS